MLSAISQFETELCSERQIDGIAKAKERGGRFGQQKRLTEQQVAELQARRQEGELIKELMAGYGISKATRLLLLESESRLSHTVATKYPLTVTFLLTDLML